MKPIIFLLSLCALPLSAQRADSIASGRISTTANMLGAGPSRLVDSYLSQEHFRGTGGTFLTITDRQKDGSPWTNKFEHQASLSFSHDRTDDAKELEGAYNFYWSRLYGWKLLGGALTIQAGAAANADLGFVYNTYGSNNPAQLRCDINIMPTAAARYDFRLFGRKAAVAYRVQLPLVGLMFSPAYGQSYYEIFNRGNYDHNIVPTTFVSAPSWRQLLAFDYNISRRHTLRLAYLGDYHQAAVNNLRQHTYNHRIMIGIVRRCRIINYRP